MTDDQNTCCSPSSEPGRSSSTDTTSSCCRKCSSCNDCTCGTECRCTETLCHCQASSILKSLPRAQLLATFKIDMHCQSCVNMTRNVLGDDSEVDFNKKQATILVDSQNEANDLLEDLLDVGLDAQLENVEQQKNESISVVTSTSSNKKRNIKNQHETLLEGEPSQNAGQPNHDPLAPPARRTATLTRSPKGDNSAIVEMIVGGMTCSMCSQAITRTLHQMPGVRNVHVSLATNVAKIQYSEPAVSLEDLKEAIESIGYSVQHVLSDAQSSMEQLQRAQDEDVFLKRRAFLWSLVGTIPITVITMILPHLFPNNALHRWLHASVGIRGHSFPRESLILALLATPVQFGSGFSFYRTSYHNISSGSLGMDVLVSIGTTASYLYAWIQTYGGEEAHAFETSAVLITFILLGKWMQNLAVRRTSQALTQLMKLQSKTAILVKDGKEETVPIDQVRPDDHVKIIRGASIPADGVVVDGEIMVDESAMTGESMPILKTPGSLVLGGTVCTESSGAFVRVTGVGENTALAQIVKLVQDAQTRKVPIQSLADTISAVFVPTVVTLAVLTYLVWYALCCTGVVPTEWHKEEGDATFSLMFGIACLVISCPCALGLATPTAIMVGTGVGARVGVLMKGGETLEYCSKVSAVVFDKTGTLTISKPRITDLETVGFSGSRDQLLWFLASLEVNSEHPLGRAVVDYATHEMDKAFSSKNPLVAPQAFQAKTGRGAKGQIKNLTVAIGNRAFVKEGGCAIPENIEMKMISMEEEGKTAVLAAMDNNIVAVLGIADEIKSDAAATIQYLKQTMGIDVWMVTGDNFRTATAVGRKLGLDESHIISEALPVAKVHQVKKLQKEGKIVLMCGDGINDSAALASAHVGMSLGTGAEIAVEASDMVLVRGHVADVVTALDLSRVIFRRIQWNLVFSLIYNCLGIPVAAGVFYPIVQVRLPPTLAAVCMALSSVSVVASSLLLKLYKQPQVDGRQEGTLRRLIQTMSGSADAHQSYLNGSEIGLREPLLLRQMEEGLTAQVTDEKNK